MNKVITMTDTNYFQYGKLFLQTRNKVNAQFVCYGCALNREQIRTLEKHDIIHIAIDKKLFETKMQYLKFSMLSEQMDSSKDDFGLAFCDWDTFFCKSLGDIFKDDFDLGITYRTECIKSNCLRAFSNGGVIFTKNIKSAYNLLLYAKIAISAGSNENLKEYDEVWRTLEIGRAPEKTHYRTNLRWWVDQCFLSALALKHYRNINDIDLFKQDMDFNGMKIKFFDCNKYNVLESQPIIKHDDSVYIRHLKNNSGAPVNLKG